MPLARSAALLVASRLGCMFIGLVGIPILLAGLGTRNFAAWAVLLGGSFLFYNLELAMPPTVVRFLSAAETGTDAGRLSADTVMSNAMVLLVSVYFAGFALLTRVAEPIAEWLNLPGTPLLHPGNLILFVFASVALCSLLKLGINGLHTIERFDLVARVDLAQVGVASLLTWIVALAWRRLDLAVLTYWIGQIAVLAVGRIHAKRLAPWRFRLSTVHFISLKRMAQHGVNLQFGDFAFFSHFQIDKFIISGMVGLTEVAHYEVASRVALALRNLPAAGFRVLLPQATNRWFAGRDTWRTYLETTRISGFAVLFFLAGPLLVSPLLLFAWVGQIGYHGRWIFLWLALGMTASVMVMPVGVSIQAEGRTSLDRRMALFAVPFHVAASLLLAFLWGKEGVALGTGASLIVSSYLYAWHFHRCNGERLSATANDLLGYFWPALPVCLLTFGLVRWVTPTVIVSRWYMAPASVALYGVFAVSVWMVFRVSGRLGPGLRGLWPMNDQGGIESRAAVFGNGSLKHVQDGKRALRVALVQTAPVWPPGSMNAYADMVCSSLSARDDVQIQRINLAPPVGLAGRIPLFSGIWGRHFWAALFGPFKLRKADVDIYHILDGGYAYLGGFCRRKPVVITAHDVIPLIQMKRKFPAARPSRMGFFIIRRNLAGMKSADRILADSGNTRCDLIEFGGVHGDKIDTVYLSIANNYLKIYNNQPSIPWRRRCDADFAFVMNVGNNGYYKNRIGVLRVFSEIQAKVNIRLKMVGPPPTREMKDMVEQYGLGNIVDFEIDPDHGRLAELYQNAALFLFPSLYEGFGWPPLEAMLFGCPVVCSNAASLPEVVGNAALACSPGDINELAQLCLNVLKDETLANALIQKGHRQVEKFSLDRMREGILAAYGKAIEGKR